MRRALVLVLIPLLMVLSSCAADPGAAPATSPSPTPVDTSELLVGEPGSRLPGDCTDLADSGLLSALVPDASIVLDTAYSPAETWSIRYQEAGLHECRWETAGGTPALSLEILADGADAYSAAYPNVADPATVYNTVGDSSSLRCDDLSVSSQGFVQCYFGFVVDGYWVDGFYDASESPLPFAEVTSTMETGLQSIAVRLHGLGVPKPGWQSPQSLVAGSTCDSLDPNGSVAVAASLGSGWSISAFGGHEDYAPIYNYLDRQTSDLGCHWADATGQFEMYVSVVAGGGWAWERLQGDSTASVSIAGSIEAIRYSNDNLSGIRLLVESSLIDVYYYPRTDEAEARAIAGVTALLPGLPFEP